MYVLNLFCTLFKGEIMSKRIYNQAEIEAAAERAAHILKDSPLAQALTAATPFHGEQAAAEDCVAELEALVGALMAVQIDLPREVLDAMNRTLDALLIYKAWEIHERRDELNHEAPR